MLTQDSLSSPDCICAVQRSSLYYILYNYTHLSIQNEFNPKHEERDIVVFMVLLTRRSLTTRVRFTNWSKFTFITMKTFIIYFTMEWARNNFTMQAIQCKIANEV